MHRDRGTSEQPLCSKPDEPCVCMHSNTMGVAVPLEVTLIDPNNREWKATYLQPPHGSPYLTGAGWRAFAQAWGMQLGDHLIFEAAAHDVHSVTVRITRSLPG